MKVLVACEYSGRVRDAFASLGHDATSCDLLPSETPGRHIIGDAIAIIHREAWDLVIAHPPCNYLANSGARWLYEADGSRNGDRWARMLEGVEFFNAILAAPCPRVCVENPVMHKHARALVTETYAQTIQPWHFGDDASKRTCLWLKGLPSLQDRNRLPGDAKTRRANQTPSGQNKLGPSADRWKERSRTYPGIAAAMAEQWGTL